jgi:TolB-like protein/Flp pilus assembly protein TadD
VTDASKAVFLSYASQDGEAAQQLCNALRTAGIEVWFDRSELRGGDVWDRQIRKQIHDCALFVAIISTTTQARVEGYFRREWRLAVERTHDMSERVAFLVPVVIDDTSDAEADVPEAFRAVQWMRLPAGQTPPAFVARIAQLLSPSERQVPTQARPTPASAAAADAAVPRQAAARGSRILLLTIAAVAILGGGYLARDKFVVSKHAAALPAESAPIAIPEQSIAVLPFVNMSSDRERESFSDGLTEEMIELLSQVPDLRVPARTSSFYFKGKSEKLATIAHELGVAYLLEGSVREAGKRLRVTAQLIRADSGYHLWSQSYDREDTDVFAVQDDIARAVVSALKLKLVAGAQATGARGTTNTEAYNQYLLGRQLDRRHTLEGYRHAVEVYRRAIALDPNYAAAYAGLAVAEARLADELGDPGGIERAEHDVEKALMLAPNEANGYVARARLRSSFLWDWSGAQLDIEKALILDPRSSAAQFGSARLLAALGRLPEAIVAQKKATDLDPLAAGVWAYLGFLNMCNGDYAAAEAALGRAIEIEPTLEFGFGYLGTLRLLEGNYQEALEAFRKIDQEGFRLPGIALTEHALGHAKESQQALDELLAKHSQESGYQIAEVFAWRRENDQAFEWLERAYKQRDGGLADMKGDPLLKSLRADPRYKALLRKMKLPE